MTNLEEKIKSYKPAVPDLPADFSNRVLSRIEEMGVTILLAKEQKSLMQWIRLVFGIILLAIGLLAVNNFIFELQMNGSLELLYFGARFFEEVFSYIPLDIILLALFITGIAAWLVGNSRFLKKSMTAIIAGCYLITGVGGVALATSGLNEQVQVRILQEKTSWPLLSWFYKERARYFVKHPNFRLGRVDQTEDGIVWLVTPNGLRIKVGLPQNTSVRTGQYLRLTGNKSSESFIANDIQFCKPKRVQRYFNHMKMMPGHMNDRMQIHHRKMHKGNML